MFLDEYQNIIRCKSHRKKSPPPLQESCGPNNKHIHTYPFMETPNIISNIFIKIK